MEDIPGYEKFCQQRELDQTKAESSPGDWRKKIAMDAQILKMADDLLELAARENT